MDPVYKCLAGILPSVPAGLLWILTHLIGKLSLFANTSGETSMKEAIIVISNPSTSGYAGINSNNYLTSFGIEKNALKIVLIQSSFLDMQE